MNVFVLELAKDKVDPQPDRSPNKLVVEDNIGESIHLHWRNMRIDMTIDDFEAFADAIEQAKEGLE